VGKIDEEKESEIYRKKRKKREIKGESRKGGKIAKTYNRA
jgi:hypothetical protein